MPATNPQVPQRHPITVEEFFRMGETGVLAPETRIELIDGELIDMPPIGPPHASRTKRVSALLHRAIGERAIVSTQDPIILGDLNAPQPDIGFSYRGTTSTRRSTRARPTYSCSSRSPTPASRTTVTAGCRSTPVSAFRRCGSSTSPAAR